MNRYWVAIVSLACFLWSGPGQGAGDQDQPFTKLRHAMIAEIEVSVRETAIYIDRQALDERVMQVMAEVPRHEFVPADKRVHAYDNRPLGIGYGQTISQPYIVALMTQLARPAADARALDVGTGSGYQAAVLAELCEKVYSIEIVEPLAASGKKRLAQLGYKNIRVRHGDGYRGWKEHAPFDLIIGVSAGAALAWFEQHGRV